MDEFEQDDDTDDALTPGKQKMSVVFVPTFDSTIGIYYRKRASRPLPLRSFPPPPPNSFVRFSFALEFVIREASSGSCSVPVRPFRTCTHTVLLDMRENPSKYGSVEGFRLAIKKPKSSVETPL